MPIEEAQIKKKLRRLYFLVYFSSFVFSFFDQGMKQLLELAKGQLAS
jgi:hypothetical protein